MPVFMPPSVDEPLSDRSANDKICAHLIVIIMSSVASGLTIGILFMYAFYVPDCTNY